MKLSIVTTLYQSAATIDEFCERATRVAEKIAGTDYEIILVNDGSPDDSLDVAVGIHNAHNHVTVVDLSRNFGHHKAMMTGLAHATGELIFLIDSDLEEEPEWGLEFLQMMHATDADVVFGVQDQRKGDIVEKFTGYVYYKVFRALTRIQQPSNIVTARLMTRQYVKSLLEHREREINIGGLWMTTGFKQVQIPVIKRSTSPTTYSFKMKFSHLVNAITSFSSLPLIFTFYAGTFISVTAMMYIGLLLIQYFSTSTVPSGYTSLIISIWLFSGLLIFFMGIQGIYLSKIFYEVKQRPLTILRHVYSHESQ